MLTQAEVKELFDYREDGQLVRKVATSGPSGAVGTVVGYYPKKKRQNIGYFEDFELAELVALEAREKYHGLYANHI